MSEVRIPEDLFAGGAEVVVSCWLYASGDRVEAGAVIAQVMVEKAQLDLVAPSSGVITLAVEENVPLEFGAVVATLND